MEVIERIPSGTIDIHFANYGGPAKKVVFCLVEGGRVAYGSLPPNSHLDSNEHRTISTGLAGSGQPRSVGFVAAFNIAGDRLFAYALTGQQIRRRMHRPLLPDRSTSDSDVLKEFYPKLGDITKLEWVAYEVKHD
jgi:hypothetical protein